MENIKLTKAPAVLKRLGHQMRGTIHFMRHHIVFKANDREIWICYPIIAEISRFGTDVRIVCKDFMFFTIKFDDEQESRLAFDTIEDLRHVPRVDNLYAFIYTPASQEKNFNGWTLYDAQAEYERMGALNGDGKWRMTTANKNHQLCPTYPKDLVVPASISDNVLTYAAKFRSKGRLPVLSYHLKLNNCTISRCSQPLVGIKKARSMQDEAIACATWSTTEGPSGIRGAQADHLVVDLRPSTNAIAQIALGGGTENMDRYKPARKIYMGVDNLHVMRDALGRVVDSLRHSDVGDEPPNPNLLERSQWLRHLEILINSSKEVVQQVYYKCSHVIVHCSDGWDRTPQITSLAMLCLDPYYRTYEGFMVLIEKEWVSFGHQFALRANLVDPKWGANSDDEPEELDIFKNVTQFLSETTKGRQDGPIFQQFLDCVYQIVCIFPNQFEFNERFLRRLLYHSYAGQYGTFLFNTEKDLLANEAPQRTRSVWDYFLARRGQFINPNYEKPNGNDDVLIIPSSWKPRWWAGAFGRVDSDMNDPNAWRQRPVKKSSTEQSTQGSIEHQQQQDSKPPSIQHLNINGSNSSNSSNGDNTGETTTSNGSNLGSKVNDPLNGTNKSPGSIASPTGSVQTLNRQNGTSHLLETNGNSKLAGSMMSEPNNQPRIAS